MATGTQQESSLGNLLSIIQAFTGSGGSTTTQKGGTTTAVTKSTLTDADAQKLVQSLLENNSGLAEVSKGQVGSGMYNSTVNAQLTNDLMSRISAQIAAQKADKVTTTTTPTTTSTVKANNGLGTTGLAALAAGTLFKNQLDPLLNGKKSILDLFSGSDSSDSSSSLSSVFTDGAGFNSADWGNYSNSSSDYTDSLSDTTLNLFGSLSDSMSSLGDGISSLFGLGDNSVISDAVIDSGSSVLDTADQSGDWLSDIKDWFSGW